MAVIAIAALGLAACGGDGGGSGDATGDSGGEGKTLIISTDLPLQGASKDASDATNQAIELYLESIDNKVGDYTIELQEYDDSTAAKGNWDDAQCAKNATEHVQNEDEVAVMGTYNSGCAKIVVPVLNQDPDGPMLMVSHANTNPGLTKEWDPGEPDKFYPTGVRNYARVIPTDDVQGPAAAQFVGQTLKAKKCYVLNDNQTYGQGVAKGFVDEAPNQGVEILGNEAWDSKATNYTALFQKVKAAGADCVYLAGIYDLNGGQLIKDKVAVLGDNTAVQLMGPDGFVGYPDMLALPESEGMYLTFGGRNAAQLREEGGAGGQLLDDYKAKYGADPASSYALYGVAAVQVILKAIEASDGTRKGVRDAVFEGEGITISAEESVTGKEITIDPATGDMKSGTEVIYVQQVKGGAETFVKEETLG
jgi:branched-chain amino acid transport system substrate-binding protein